MIATMREMTRILAGLITFALLVVGALALLVVTFALALILAGKL